MDSIKLEKIISASRTMMTLGAPDKEDGRGFNKVYYGTVSKILNKQIKKRTDYAKLCKALIRHKGQVESIGYDIEEIKNILQDIEEKQWDVAYRHNLKLFRVDLPYDEQLIKKMKAIKGSYYKDGFNYVPISSVQELAREFSSTFTGFVEAVRAALASEGIDGKWIRENYPEEVKEAEEYRKKYNENAEKDNYITLDFDGNIEMITVKMEKYDSGAYTAIKQLPKDKRKYDPDTKVWNVSPYCHDMLIDNIRKLSSLQYVDNTAEIAKNYPQLEVELYKTEAVKVDTREAMEIVLNRYSVIAGKNLYPHQPEAVAFMLSVGNCINADSMGLGKMQPISEPVLTINGWVKMGDIKLGDHVIGLDGKETEVLGIYPHGIKEIYRVKFNDGSFTDCGLEHLWAVNSSSRNSRGNSNKIMTTKEIMQSGLKDAAGNAKWYIPIVQPVQHNKKELKIDPYTLGVLLGDGSLLKTGIGLFTDKEIIDNCDFMGGEFRLSEVKATAYCGVINRATKLKEALKHYGLLGKKAYNKEIPEDYMFSSVEDRLALLQGLMDTDGTADKKVCEFYSSSKKLAEQVQQLAWSLGGIGIMGKPRIASYHSKIKNMKGKEQVLTMDSQYEAYRVNIKLPNQFDTFRLRRKLDKYEKPIKYFPSRAIVGIEFAKMEEAQCIRVAAEDHLYVTKDYVVTHNTLEGMLAANIQRERLDGSPVLCIVPVPVKTNWVRELTMWLEEKSGTICVVETQKIIQYAYDKDSQDKFSRKTVRVGKVSAQEYSEILSDIKPDWVIINYDIIEKMRPVINDWKKRSSCKIIMLDEAHYIKNDSASRTKAILGFTKIVLVDKAGNVIKRGAKDEYGRKINGTQKKIVEEGVMEGIPLRYALTGTPNTGRNRDMYNLLKYIDHPLAQNKKAFLERYCDPQENRFATGGFDYNGATNSDELFSIVASNMIQRKKEDVIEGFPEKTRQYHYVDVDLSEYWKYWDNYVATYEERTGRPFNENAAQLTELSVLRNHASRMKIPIVKDFADQMVNEQGRKVVIFTGYTETANALKEMFGDACVMIVGGISEKKKDEAVQAFQNDDKVRVIVCNYLAAGVGITLTAANDMIMADLMWRPDQHFQAEDREWRIGQKNNVFIHYIIANGTHEISVQRVVEEKALVIDKMEKKNYEVASDWKETFRMFLSEMKQLRKDWEES